MAVQARFCGRCGAQLPPGAPFCGRCGAPQQALPIAPPPLYAYPSAPAPEARGLRRFGTSQIAIAAGLLIILSVTTVVISAFAASQVIANHQSCTSNCGARFVAPLPESRTYHSSAFGFEVDYSSKWTVRSQSSDGVILGTRLGLLQVTGSKATSSPDQVIAATLNALSSSVWQNVTRVAVLKGAHIGEQDGVGAVYAANLIGANAKAAKVRFVVIAATHGGVTVVLFGVNPADPKDFPNGIPEGQAFDYLCQEFRWG